MVNQQKKNDPILKMDNKENFIENLNHYMAESGTILANEQQRTQPYYQRTTTNNRFVLEPYTENQIKTIIKKLKNTKSSGHDGLNIELLRYNIEQLSTPITTIINKSIRDRKVPDKLKISKVTPIHKEGNPQEFGNYRPINVLPIINKVCEKLINNDLVLYLEENGLLDERQYGFRSKSNTSTAIFDFTSYIQKSRDNKQKTSIIFLDLKKAFETVDRKIQLRKMFAKGIYKKMNKNGLLTTSRTDNNLYKYQDIKVN